jgi:hypothetical protein
MKEEFKNLATGLYVIFAILILLSLFFFAGYCVGQSNYFNNKNQSKVVEFLNKEL